MSIRYLLFKYSVKWGYIDYPLRDSGGVDYPLRMHHYLSKHMCASEVQEAVCAMFMCASVCDVHEAVCAMFMRASVCAYSNNCYYLILLRGPWPKC